MRLAPATIQVLQDLMIVAFAPFVSGAISHLEARIQGRRGPRVLQPYYDLAKLFGKEQLVPEDASWVFLAAPVVAFVCYLIVPLLIPELTTFALPLGYIADIIGGAFFLALAAFSVSLAAAETGGPYAQLGSSRAMTFAALIEPAIVFVTFTVAIITTTDLPYAESAAARASLGQAVRPAHLLAAVAFFLAVLSDTARIPVETHSSTVEFGMIDEARTFEHSGPALALLKWGTTMKQLILYVLLINVFSAPWGLSSSRQVGPVLLAIPIFIGKALGVGFLFALIDNSFSKLRLFRITEFMAAALVLAALALLVLYLGGG
ncbi:MAG TPA: NADH-quinone oxidoreductase subunit H [Acidimicrobiales bacterium]|jgi:formate hydrogenlyase subunit 4|nr:NADH-quinone oxidoreductase subunit H [Acidimicrobiales bacterium]